MKIVFITLAAASALSLGTNAGEFYDRFILETKTNSSPGGPIVRTSSLLDTNNRSAKITNGLINLKDVARTEGVGQLKLGMGMDEVVSLWGKPTGGFAKCFGGRPTLFYDTVAVGFENGRVDGIRLTRAFSFGDRAERINTVEDCIRILGEPTDRYDRQTTHLLVYRERNSYLRVDFHDGEVVGVKIERTATQAIHRTKDQ